MIFGFADEACKLSVLSVGRKKVKTQMDLKTKHALVVASLVSGLLLKPQPLQAEPQLSGEVNKAYCQDALLLAKSVFHSGTSRLFAINAVPADFQNKLVLGALSLELPGRGDLPMEPQIFTSADNLYWQQQAAHGVRLVLTETAMGWQGEHYRLLQLAPEIELSQLAANDDGSVELSKTSALLENSWRPPVVFQHNNSGDFWFIDVGEPYQTLGGWEIYGPATTGYQQSCSIQFTDNNKTPHQPLPEPVQQLIGLLDQTLGSGQDEGTLQPTARNRLMARHFWANAALRPWAISVHDSYNDQLQVDTGLKNWSLLNEANLQIYQQIQSLLPLAQQALAGYYQHNFALDDKAAAKLASWVLEIGYCVNFTFSGGGGAKNTALAGENPWPTFHRQPPKG